MEKNKRTKNSILVGFIIGVITFSIFISILIFKLKGDIEGVDLIKQDLNTKFNYFNNTNKSGLSFDDFKSEISLNADVNSDIYTKNVISSINETFYTKHIKNNGSGAFMDYITTKEKSIEVDKNVLLDKEKKVNKILPIYTEDVNLSNNNGVINSFNLVNNIEALFKTFDIKYGNNISIDNISIVPGFKSSESVKGLESDIFSIPMTLTLDGTRQNLENFIHYAENVGTFSIKGNGIVLYNDNDILSNGMRIGFYNNDIYDNNVKFLTGSNTLEDQNSDYDIYNNQLINIKELIYTKSFLETKYYNNTTITLSLEIFVRGIPNYKIEDYISKFLANYNELNKKVDSKLKVVSNLEDSDSQVNEGKLLKIKNYLSTLDKDAKFITKSLNTKDGLPALYKKVVEYNASFSNLNKIVDSVSVKK